MQLSDFDFNLPDEAIALRPSQPRDHARLLQVSATGELSDHHVFDLPGLLKPTDLLVLNETRVFPAALSAIRPARAHGGGGDVSIGINLHQRIGPGQWHAFVRPAKRVRPNDRLDIGQGLSCIVMEKNVGGQVVIDFGETDRVLMEKFEKFGKPPLPPYIARQRSVDDNDFEDYQTVFAKETGSIAAPTAGLHFTEKLFSDLEKAGVELCKVTLHVGAGTFLPVKTEDLSDHEMHKEWYSISETVAEKINKAKEDGRRIISVGTTSLRALESSWDNGRVQPTQSETGIFIKPGYEFKVIDGLMTNFHLPKSTLFMLVSALCGLNEMKAAYDHALKTGYRFYSYGDSSLLWAKTK